MTPALPGNTGLTALNVFHRCIERARNLVRLHETAHGEAKKPEKFLSDAHRAAIVLAISALDAYVRTCVLERIRVLLAGSASLPPALSERIKSFLKDEGLLAAARSDDLIERVEKAFMKDFEKRSFQGTEAITNGLQLVGIADVFKVVASRAGKNEQSLREELDKFTQRRHSIAHRGDYDFSQNPPRELTATKKEAAECIALVALVAEKISEI